MTNMVFQDLKDREKHFNLKQRELEVLYLMVKGKTNLEIAEDLNITIHTVKVYVASILQKFEVRDRVQAVIKAISEKLVDI